LYPSNYYFYTGLGYNYLRLGKYDASKEAFLKSIELAPDVAFNYYNVACFYSIQEMNEEGLEWLVKALDKGFDNFDHLETDTDMANVRSLDKYKDLVKKYKRK
jgi:tetratricopeptide (TPR) repeat protein